MSKVPNPNDLYGDDHPTINDAVYAITVCGQIPVEEIPRDRAARLLNMWAHRGALTPREVDAILARFPETVTAEADQVVEAFTLGLKLGKAAAPGVVHAFTVARVEDEANDWIWICTCGKTLIDIEGDVVPIQERLILHALGGPTRRPAA